MSGEHQDQRPEDMRVAGQSTALSVVGREGGLSSPSKELVYRPGAEPGGNKGKRDAFSGDTVVEAGSIADEYEVAMPGLSRFGRKRSDRKRLVDELSVDGESVGFR